MLGNIFCEIVEKILNKRKAKKIGAWLNYMIGFSGCGPTALDPIPDRKLGRKEKQAVQKLYKALETEKARRHEAFRTACIDILGEDPDTDWD